MSDSPNMNDRQHDYKEWWDSFKKEQEAKNAQLDAEKRMERNDALEDFGEEVSAAADWTGAKWEEFKAKVTKWSNEAEIKTDDAI